MILDDASRIVLVRGSSLRSIPRTASLYCSASCRSSRHGRRSGTSADAPSRCRSRGTLHIRSPSEDRRSGLARCVCRSRSWNLLSRRVQASCLLASIRDDHAIEGVTVDVDRLHDDLFLIDRERQKMVNRAAERGVAVASRGGESRTTTAAHDVLPSSPGRHNRLARRCRCRCRGNDPAPRLERRSAAPACRRSP